MKNYHKSFFLKAVIFFSLLLTADKSLNESIEYIKQGNYIYKDKYIGNDNQERNYYNSIYKILSSEDSRNKFLNGLLESNGEKSSNYFKDFYLKQPQNQYADDAVIKVAEYYYASGLYIQSSEWYRKIPFEYSDSKYLDKSIAYFLNSLLIAGHKDTVNYYMNIFKNKYPKLDYSEEYLIEANKKKNHNFIKKNQKI